MCLARPRRCLVGHLAAGGRGVREGERALGVRLHGAERLALGDSTSVRVTVTFVPAGSAAARPYGPLTVSALARVALAGALMLMVASGPASGRRGREGPNPLAVDRDGEQPAAVGRPGQTRRLQEVRPLLAPVLGSSYVRGPRRSWTRPSGRCRCPGRTSRRCRPPPCRWGRCPRRWGSASRCSPVRPQVGRPVHLVEVGRTAGDDELGPVRADRDVAQGARLRPVLGGTARPCPTPRRRPPARPGSNSPPPRPACPARRARRRGSARSTSGTARLLVQRDDRLLAGQVQRTDVALGRSPVAEPELPARQGRVGRPGAQADVVARGLGQGGGVDGHDVVGGRHTRVQGGGVGRQLQAGHPGQFAQDCGRPAGVVRGEDLAGLRVADEHPLVHTVGDDVAERGSGRILLLSAAAVPAVPPTSTTELKRTANAVAVEILRVRTVTDTPTV